MLYAIGVYITAKINFFLCYHLAFRVRPSVSVRPCLSVRLKAVGGQIVDDDIHGLGFYNILLQ